MSPAALHSFCHAIPKAELHCHLLGTVRHATFAELASAANAPLSADEITAFYTRREKPVGVLRVLRALDEFLLRTPTDLERITFEYLQDAAAHNVRYAEFFWNPTGTVHTSKISYAQAQAGIIRAIHQAQTQFGIIGRLIPSIDREASPQAALEMVQWVVQNSAPEVLGIGMDYREVDRPPELFTEAYRAAKQAGLKLTAHAGEFGMPWTNVQTAVEQLQLDRVDHGYTIIDNPALAQSYAARGLVFTVVPTNSYYLRTLAPERWALDHPIRAMAKLGLRLHPNTDDPTLHHVTPTGAWEMMVRDFGFTAQDLRGFMHNGLDAAWISPEQRANWRTQWTAEFDALLEQWT